jgi:MFS family permease
MLIIAFFLISLGFSGMQGVYALWAQASFSWGPSEVGYIFGFIGILSIIIQTQILPRALKVWPERTLLKISLPLLALGFLTMSFASSLPLHLLANALIVLGNSLANPTLSALATESIPPEEYGETLGLLQSAGSLGRIAGPAAAGEVFTIAGHNTPFRISALIFLATGLYLSQNLKPGKAKSA